jgi:hypothetical protein
MKPAAPWTRALTPIGYLSMLIGALDPLEGSLAILPGSALVAVGAYLSPDARRWLAFRIGTFAAIAFGVAALFGLSAAGGIGGKAGHSLWWGLLILPYLVGWLLGIAGPGSPRWVHGSALVVGAWYLMLPILAFSKTRGSPRNHSEALVFIGSFGLVTFAACLWRLLRRATPPAP